MMRFHVTRWSLLAPLVLGALGCDGLHSTIEAQLAETDSSASLPDAASPDSDPGAPQVGCINGSLRWGQTGGDSGYEVLSHLDPCSVFTSETVPGFFNHDPDVSCTQDVVSHPDSVSVRDVNTALDNPDVISSFADAPIQYGLFGASGGGTFRIVWRDSAISVGGDCNGYPDCLPTPDAVGTLVELLKQMTAEQHEQQPCSDVFDGPFIVSTD